MLKNKYGETARDDTDSEEEDPVDKHMSVKQRMSKKIGKLSNVSVAFTIFKAFVGIGVLNMPGFCYSTGWLVQPFIVFSSLALSIYCVSLLIQAAEYYKMDSLSGIAEASYGKVGKVITDICLVASQMCFCTNYCYFICSQLAAVVNCINIPAGVEADKCYLPTNLNDGHTNISKYLFLGPLLLIFVPLVWIRKTEKLAFTHVISDVIIFIVIATICTFGAMALSDNGLSTTLPSEGWQGIGGMATGVSSSVLAFEGIGVVLPVKDLAAD